MSLHLCGGTSTRLDGIILTSAECDRIFDRAGHRRLTEIFGWMCLPPLNGRDRSAVDCRRDQRTLRIHSRLDEGDSGRLPEVRLRLHGDEVGSSGEEAIQLYSQSAAGFITSPDDLVHSNWTEQFFCPVERSCNATLPHACRKRLINRMLQVSVRVRKRT